MDFYTFRYRCCFRRTLMCKKVGKKNYKLLLNPCMSVRLSAFSSQNRVNRLDISIEFLKFAKYDETLIVQDIILFLYVCRT